jgi:hypothetical protein
MMCARNGPNARAPVVGCMVNATSRHRNAMQRRWLQAATAAVRGVSRPRASHRVERPTRPSSPRWLVESLNASYCRAISVRIIAQTTIGMPRARNRRADATASGSVLRGGGRRRNCTRHRVSEGQARAPSASCLPSPTRNCVRDGWQRSIDRRRTRSSRRKR